MPLDRRSFLRGLIAIAAPAVIRTPGLLMPVRALKLEGYLGLAQVKLEGMPLTGPSAQLLAMLDFRDWARAETDRVCGFFVPPPRLTFPVTLPV
jgi:hypothetical protein